MLKILRISFRILTEFHTYKPQKLTLKIFFNWLKQFPRHLHSHLLTLVNQIIYISEKEAKHYLVDLNKEILNRLSAANINPNQIIYIQIDDAGSSSPVMLNLLRDAANLIRRGCILIDSRNTKCLLEKTSGITQSAIIYVDDFSGSGRQFKKNHKWVSDFIRGSFSEFFLAPCICEEAYQNIKDIGVEPVCSILHLKKERPLHNESGEKFAKDREMILNISRKLNPKYPFGFENLATMVIFYRNSPNSTPLILRGNLGQIPHFGIFPRHDDLPVQ